MCIRDRFHAGVGIAVPYGNAKTIPFEKQYFSGGANSVRGWSCLLYTSEKYGSDPLRWYMITNSSPWDNLKFDVEGVEEVRRKFFGTLYNCLLYTSYPLYNNPFLCSCFNSHHNVSI